jgi:hypothetical protein
MNAHVVSNQRRPCTQTWHVYTVVSGDMWRAPSKFLQCLQLSMRISITSKRKADRYIMKVKFSLWILWEHIQGAEVLFHSFLTLAPDGGQPFILLTTKVQQLLYRRGRALRLPWGWRRVRFSALGSGRLYSQNIILVLITVSDSVELRATVRLAGWCQ